MLPLSDNNGYITEIAVTIAIIKKENNDIWYQALNSNEVLVWKKKKLCLRDTSKSRTKAKVKVKKQKIKDREVKISLTKYRYEIK